MRRTLLNDCKASGWERCVNPSRASDVLAKVGAALSAKNVLPLIWACFRSILLRLIIPGSPTGTMDYIEIPNGCRLSVQRASLGPCSRRYLHPLKKHFPAPLTTALRGSSSTVTQKIDCGDDPSPRKPPLRTRYGESADQ